MEQNVKLNTTDGWENIVNGNANRRAYERLVTVKMERERRCRKLWLTACGIASIGITFVILGVTGATSCWLATLVAAVSVVASSFVLGRYVEAKKG